MNADDQEFCPREFLYDLRHERMKRQLRDGRGFFSAMTIHDDYEPLPDFLPLLLNGCEWRPL